jgi:hypothetical protein
MVAEHLGNGDHRYPKVSGNVLHSRAHIVIQYIEPQAEIPVYDDFSEKNPTVFPKLRDPRFPKEIPWAKRCIPVDIDNFTDYRTFLSMSFRTRASGGKLLTQLGKTRDFDHGIMRSLG